MGWIESLQKAINYIENHLMEEISIEEIAKQANTSMFHFQRTFAILTDISVGEYIRRRRLTLAAHELIKSNCRIVDLAYKYGYDTPEAFTKAFRKQHGIAPSEMRARGGKIVSYNQLMIQVSLKGANPMNVRIVEKNAFQAVGIKREFSLENDESVKKIPRLWNEVNSNGTCDRLFKLNNGQIKGVLGISVTNLEKDSQKVMDYWVATEYEGDLPEGFLKIKVPAFQWAVFEVLGPMPEAMEKVWKNIYSEWFPSSGYNQAGSIEFEVYLDEEPTKFDLYSEIWIPVK